MKIEESSGGWGLTLRREEDTSDNVYFKGSDKYWIETDTHTIGVIFSNGRNTNSDQVICLDNFVCPWSPDFKFFQKKAMEHRVDIRMFTWDKQTWSSIFTWYRNGDIEETDRKYEDFVWDCPYPDVYGVC